MRNAFAAALARHAQHDPRVVLLSADVGNRLFDPFKEAAPDRFVNCGIAEAAMIGTAAGLSMSGLRPVCYTIAPFATARCLEQVRVDLCYHRQPVLVVGVGAGFCYGQLGATHEALEDIAHMRSLPGMTVACPADVHELRALLAAALEHEGPVYLRLGKKGEPDIHDGPIDLGLGAGIVLREGPDVCLIGTGIVMPAAIEASALLKARGHDPRVVSLPTVKPLDGNLLRDCFDRWDLVVTIEEHSLCGGLGSAVAEWRTAHDDGHARLRCLGAPDAYHHVTASPAALRRQAGLDAAGIVTQVEAALAPLEATR